MTSKSVVEISVLPTAAITNNVKPVFHYAEFCARSGIFLCLVISRVELIRKDKDKFHSARKIFFVIILLKPESKTLFIVLFSSLCLEIFIFYFVIYRIFIFLARPMEKQTIKTNNKKHQNNALFRKKRKSIL